MESYAYEESADQAIDKLDDVVPTVRDVEASVKENGRISGWIVSLAVVSFFISLSGKAWHSKLRYALQYGVDTSQVLIEDEPHDCEFLASPVGDKYCHYDRNVSTLRWATSTAQQAIASYDEGKTWYTFTPYSNVPQYPTVEKVFISWEKKQD